jgi:hypothetical protein
VVGTIRQKTKRKAKERSTDTPLARTKEGRELVPGRKKTAMTTKSSMKNYSWLEER